MARPFELKRFLRQTPVHLVERYCADNNLEIGIDFGSPDAKDMASVAAALRGGPDAQRLRIEADFRDIDAIASERGFRAMMDEADWHIRNNPATFGGDRDLRQRLAAMENDHERALWVFLNRPAYWRGTLRFFQADNLSPSSWQKRKNLPKVDARVDEEAKLALEEALGNYLHVVHGRGRRCEVEMLRRVDLDYYYCFGEGFSEAPHAWVDGRLGRHPRNPAHEVIYIYSKTEGKLDTYSRGGKREVPDLEAIFADIVLGHQNLEPSDEDERIYDLDILKDPDFAFRYDPLSEIQEVVIRTMRVSYRYGERPHFVISGDYKANPRSVFDELGKLAAGVPLDHLHVTQVELGVRFSPTSTKQNRQVLARLTHPNRCSLRYDGLDLVVRKMLVDSGLEPRDP